MQIILAQLITVISVGLSVGVLGAYTFGFHLVVFVVAALVMGLTSMRRPVIAALLFNFAGVVGCELAIIHRDGFAYNPYNPGGHISLISIQLVFAILFAQFAWVRLVVTRWHR
jgi:hypothetical protein